MTSELVMLRLPNCFGSNLIELKWIEDSSTSSARTMIVLLLCALLSDLRMSLELPSLLKGSRVPNK